MILTLIFGLNTTALALPDEQAAAIQSFVDEARRISGAPGISVAVFADGETHFFSSGYANHAVPADEDTLWELASVTKAFARGDTNPKLNTVKASRKIAGFNAFFGEA